MAKLKPILPWVAIGAALLAVILIWLGMPQRQQMLTDTGKTRLVAEAALNQVVTLHPNALEEAAFTSALSDLPGNAYVVNTWLFAADGELRYSSGMVPKTGSAAESATAETRRLLDTIPADALTPEQRTLLLAASAVQMEGEHNDVYHHLVQEVRSADGALLGWAGIAYDINPAIGGPAWTWIASILAWLVCMAVYWLSLPLWVWLDARQRGEKAAVWAIFVLIGNLVALLAYLLVRPPQTKPEIEV